MTSREFAIYSSRGGTFDLKMKTKYGKASNNKYSWFRGYCDEVAARADISRLEIFLSLNVNKVGSFVPNLIGCLSKHKKRAVVEQAVISTNKKQRVFAVCTGAVTYEEIETMRKHSKSHRNIMELDRAFIISTT